MRSDWLLGVLVMAAFVLTGWKTFNRAPAPQYLVAPRLAASAPGVKRGAAAQSRVSADGRFRYEAQFVSAAPGQAVHAASLVELRDGGLRAVWFSGSREGAGDVTIQSAIMDPQSLQWGAETTLFDRSRVQRSLLRYVKKIGNPVIARAADGSLVLWMVNVSMGGWAGSAISWSRSSDEGASWSEPRRLVTSPFLNISTLVKAMPVALKAGQTALPVYHEFVTKFAEVLRLDPQGQVADKVRIPSSHGSLQPVLLPKSAQGADIYMRSAGLPAVTTSSTADAGHTWSAATATAWPNPDSAIAGLVTRVGARWMALNPTQAGRNKLSLFQAPSGEPFDTSRTWTVESPLAAPQGLSRQEFSHALGRELKAAGASDADAQAYIASAIRQLCGEDLCAQEFSYPYLLQSTDGYVHLVYTWHRTRIKHVRFDPMQAAMADKAGASNASLVH